MNKFFFSTLILFFLFSLNNLNAQTRERMSAVFTLGGVFDGLSGQYQLIGVFTDYSDFGYTSDSVKVGDRILDSKCDMYEVVFINSTLPNLTIEVEPMNSDTVEPNGLCLIYDPTKYYDYPYDAVSLPTKIKSCLDRIRAIEIDEDIHQLLDSIPEIYVDSIRQINDSTLVAFNHTGPPDTFNISGGGAYSGPAIIDTFVRAADFNINNGILTLDRSYGANVFVALDGRYLIDEVDGDTTNEIQVLSINEDTVFLSKGGGFVIIPGVAGSTDNQQIDYFALDGNLLGLEIEDDGQARQTVDLSPYLDNTDEQVLDVAQLVGTDLQLSISNDGEATKVIDLSSLQDGTGTDDQIIDVLSLVGTVLNISLEDDGVVNETLDLASINTDEQFLDVAALVGTDLQLSISNDGVATEIIDLSSLQDGTGTDDQQIDYFALDGNLLGLEIENDGQVRQTVDLSAYLDNTDDQVIDKFNLTGSNILELSIENDGVPDLTVDLSGLGGGGGTDDQTITYFAIDVSDILGLEIEDDGIARQEVDLSPYLDNTDNQTIDVLSLVGTVLNISLEDDGEVNQTVDLASLQDGFEANTDDQTILTFEDLGNTLRLEIEDDGVPVQTVDLLPYLDNTDDQQIDYFNLDGNTLGLEIENDGQVRQTVDLSSYLDDTDEQTIDYFNIVNNILGLEIENDGIPRLSVNLNPYLDNTDDQVIDKFNLTGSNVLELSLENDGVPDLTVDLSGLGGGSSGTDDQTIDYFDLSGNTLGLEIEDDGVARQEVDLSPYLDNTDQQVLDVAQLVGNNLQLSLSNDGEATKVIDLSSLQDGFEANTDDQTITTFDLTSNTLTLEIEDDGIAPQTVDLSGYLDNTDAQFVDVFQINTNTLSVSLSNSATTPTVDLSPYLDNTDDQTIDVFNLNGNTLELSLENDGEVTQTVDLSSLSSADGNGIYSGSGDLSGNTTVNIFNSSYDYLRFNGDGFGESYWGDFANFNPMGSDNLWTSGGYISDWEHTYINADESLIISAGESPPFDATTDTDRITSDFTGIWFSHDQGTHFGDDRIVMRRSPLSTDFTTDNIDYLLGVSWPSAQNNQGVLYRVDINEFLNDSVVGGGDDQTIDVFNLNGTTLELSLENDGQATQTVDLSSLQDGTGTDDQTITYFQIAANSLGLEIEDDGIPRQTVDLSPYLDDTDDQGVDLFEIDISDDLRLSLDDDGELPNIVSLAEYRQQVDQFDIFGNQLRISLSDDGVSVSTVDLSPYLDNTDDQIIDVFNLNGNTLELSLENDGQATQTVDLSSLSTTVSADNLEILVGTGASFATYDNFTFNNTTGLFTIVNHELSSTTFSVGKNRVSNGTAEIELVGDESSYPNGGLILQRLSGGTSRLTHRGTGNLEFISEENGSYFFSDASALAATLFLDVANDEVGINTITPNHSLDVVGDMELTGQFFDENNSAGTPGQILSTTATGTDWIDAPVTGTDDQTIDVFNLNGNTLELSLENDGQATQTVDLSSLSTSVSADNLEILVGTGASFDTYDDFTFNNANDIFTVANHELSSTTFSVGKNRTTNGTAEIELVGDQSSYANGGLIFQRLSGGTSRITHRSASNWEFLSEENGSYFFSDASALAATLFLDVANDEVGINTISPDYDLDIDGDMGLSGQFFDENNSAGTPGQILSTTATGTDWINAPATGTDDQQITTFEILSNTLRIILEDGGGLQTVDLSPYLDNTDEQTIDSFYITSDLLYLEIENDGLPPQSVDLGEYRQTVNQFDIFGNQLRISLSDDGVGLSTVDLSPYLDNTDNQTIDFLDLIGTSLHISIEDDGQINQIVDLSPLQDGTGTDDQTIDVFNLNGTTLELSLENDGQATQTVDLSSLSSSVTLTSTQVAYGSGTNTVTSESDFNYVAGSNQLNIGDTRIQNSVLSVGKNRAANGTAEIEMVGDESSFPNGGLIIQRLSGGTSRLTHEGSGNWEFLADDGGGYFFSDASALAATLHINPTTDRVGINEITPSQALHIDGSMRLEDGFYDGNNQIGTAGQVLSSTGTITDWIDVPTPTYSLGAGRIVYTDGSGDLTTEAALLYDDTDDKITLGNIDIESNGTNGDLITIDDDMFIGDFVAVKSIRTDGVQLLLRTESNHSIQIYTNGTANNGINIDGSGRIGYGTGSSATSDHLFEGNVEFDDGILDGNGDIGTAGQILSSTGTITDWIDAPSGGGSISEPQGQIVFGTGSGVNSESNLFWDESNNRLGLGTNTPEERLHVDGKILMSNNTPFEIERTDGTNHDILRLDNNNDLIINRDVLTSGANIDIVVGAANSIRINDDTNTRRFLLNTDNGHFYSDGQYIIHGANMTTQFIEYLVGFGRGGNGAAGIRFYNNSGGYGTSVGALNVDASGAMTLLGSGAGNMNITTTNPSFGIALGTNSTTAMFIANDQMVGIGGVTNPLRDLHIEKNNDPGIRLTESGSGTDDNFDIYIATPSLLKMNFNPEATGNSLFDINSMPGDGTSEAIIRMFRDANTTGDVSLQILEGNNTSNVNTRLGGNCYTFFDKDAHGVTYGNSATPTRKHDFYGNVRFRDQIADENDNLGSAGDILVESGTGLQWQSPYTIWQGTLTANSLHTSTTYTLAQNVSTDLSDANYTLSSNSVTINSDGRYKITCSFCIDQTGSANTRTEALVQMRRAVHPSTIFTTVSATTKRLYSRQNAEGSTCATIYKIMDLNDGDDLAIFAAETDLNTNMVILSEGFVWSIEKLGP